MSTTQTTAPPASAKANDPNRPTHIALELRLPIDQAEALEVLLAKFEGLVQSGVMSTPKQMREPLLLSLKAILENLRQRQPPFD